VKTPVNKSSGGKNLLGENPVTREKVRVRARALASMEGRNPTDVSQIDYEQAKRELTGKSGLAQQEAMLDLLPVATPVEPVLGSTGRQIPESSNEDEDIEGRSESEQLVEKGVVAAEHDQIVQAARATKGKGRREQ
jgi:hypothetical protein